MAQYNVYHSNLDPPCQQTFPNLDGFLSWRPALSASLTFWHNHCCATWWYAENLKSLLRANFVFDGTWTPTNAAGQQDCPQYQKTHQSSKSTSRLKFQYHWQPPKMKIPALFIFFLALLNLAEAGCDENGCCFCTDQSGEVVRATKGPYRLNCNVGFFCACGYNSEQEWFYGACTKERKLKFFRSGPCTNDS